MDPKTFLDQPIKVIAPNGYKACLDCGKYFHHKITWCPGCGKEIVAWTEVSIADFIRKTAADGSGPTNTVWSYLNRKQGRDWPREPFTPENQAIYDRAKEIQEQAREEESQ